MSEIRLIDVDWHEIDLKDWSTWPKYTGYYLIVANEKSYPARRVFHVYLEKKNPSNIEDISRAFSACDANGHECDDEFDKETITHWAYAYFKMPTKETECGDV